MEVRVFNLCNVLYFMNEWRVGDKDLCHLHWRGGENCVKIEKYGVEIIFYFLEFLHYDLQGITLLMYALI